MRFINQISMLLICVLCWLPVAQADVSNNEAGPKAVVEQAANQVITVLIKEGDAIIGSTDKIKKLADEHILPHFDFDRISYLVLGNVWKEATDEQKAGFQNEFKQLLMDTYATALSKFSTDEKIIYKDVLTSPKNENVAIVPTVIQQKGAGPVDVAYWMYRTEGVWRIYDVAISGVSLMKNYRADFAGQMYGKGLDDLINTLKIRNKPVEQAATVKPAPQVQNN